MEQKETLQKLKVLLSKTSLDKEKIEMVIHGMEWILPENNIIERQEYINKAKQYWIDNKTVKSNYFENQIVKPILEIIPRIQPITIEMIEDYIIGIVFLPHALKDKKLEPVVNRLTKPTLDKVAEILFSNVHRNFVIDKIVDKKAMIQVRMFPEGFDIQGTREALKGYIEDKPIYPTKRNLDKLKVNFKLHQEQKFRDLYKEHTGQTLTGFRCALSYKTVKEIYYVMDEKYIKTDLDNFLAVFSKTSKTVSSPIEWLIKSQKKPYRGHQTKLYLFIETMLNGKISAEDKRKAVDLFIDEKGKFFNPKMKEPNENDRNTHNIFETLISNAKEKTRPA